MLLSGYWPGSGLPLGGRATAGGKLPFVSGCRIGREVPGTGDWVAIFSALMRDPKGEPDRALLGGRMASLVADELGRALPFTNVCDDC